jgi:hypothetical protein
MPATSGVAALSAPVLAMAGADGPATVFARVIDLAQGDASMVWMFVLVVAFEPDERMQHALAARSPGAQVFDGRPEDTPACRPPRISTGSCDPALVGSPATRIRYLTRLGAHTVQARRPAAGASPPQSAR